MSTPEEIAALKKKRTFRKFQFRGVELDKLLDLSHEELMEMVTCRARRRFSRGLKRKPMAFIKKLRKAKKEAGGEKPDGVKTHLRNMIIVPEMIGSVCGVYNGKTFTTVEIKVRVILHQLIAMRGVALTSFFPPHPQPEMIGMYLAEFAISYKPVGHGRPGIGATNSSRFIPLK